MIPSSVFSQLGPVPVVPLEGMLAAGEERSFGHWDEVNRKIDYDPSACPAAQLFTLFHEMMHLALADSGAVHNFTDKQQEIICDAAGGYLAAATLAGYLKLPER